VLWLSCSAKIFSVIIETLNSSDPVRAEFDEQIFNALVEKLEILNQRILFLN